MVVACENVTAARTETSRLLKSRSHAAQGLHHALSGTHGSSGGLPPGALRRTSSVPRRSSSWRSRCWIADRFRRGPVIWRRDLPPQGGGPARAAPAVRPIFSPHPPARPRNLRCSARAEERSRWAGAFSSLRLTGGSTVPILRKCAGFLSQSRRLCSISWCSGLPGILARGVPCLLGTAKAGGRGSPIPARSTSMARPTSGT
jgi:hypothetical protein